MPLEAPRVARAARGAAACCSVICVRDLHSLEELDATGRVRIVGSAVRGGRHRRVGGDPGGDSVGGMGGVGGVGGVGWGEAVAVARGGRRRGSTGDRGTAGRECCSFCKSRVDELYVGWYGGCLLGFLSRQPRQVAASLKRCLLKACPSKLQSQLGEGTRPWSGEKKAIFTTIFTTHLNNRLCPSRDRRSRSSVTGEEHPLQGVETCSFDVTFPLHVPGSRPLVIEGSSKVSRFNSKCEGMLGASLQTFRRDASGMKLSTAHKRSDLFSVTAVRRHVHNV